MRSGRLLLLFSIVSRAMVLLLLCYLALLTSYHNLKVAHNNPRLVEMDTKSKPMRIFYEKTDAFFSYFGDPVEMARKNAGMTWSIRLGDVAVTDPVAAISVMAKSHKWKTGFALGLLIPISIALIFGRVFCSYFCPASLLFFSISRVRRLIGKFFYLPDWNPGRGLAWGVLVGGLIAALWAGHGIWTLILPYFAIGQTLFHGLAYGTMSFSIGAIITFSLVDLFFGKQFTCRYICPTGRLLGAIGRKSAVTIRRDASLCVEACTSCIDVCPLKVKPKFDMTTDCSLCGECLTLCPTKALKIGLRASGSNKLVELPEDSPVN